MKSLSSISKAIVECRKCPRLLKYCQSVATEKRRSYKDEMYWGKPVPGFGDPEARLLLVGLAPAAHGANRTGRMFTGDRSGEWLYRALHKAGFANQPHSLSKTDGLLLRDAYISAAARCAPPGNKPLPEELANCSEYLKRELELLQNLRGVLALGQIGMNSVWGMLAPGKPRPKFSHGSHVTLPDGKFLLLSFHPSQQNTFTGRLTEPMFDRVFTQAKTLLDQTSV